MNALDKRLPFARHPGNTQSVTFDLAYCSAKAMHKNRLAMSAEMTQRPELWD